MKTSNSRIGEFVVSRFAGETVNAYVPPPLPPVPGLELGPLYPALDRATQAIGRLEGISTILPDTDMFIALYVRKEAVLSSQIEGTQSSLSDLLMHEGSHEPPLPTDDLREVSNYIDAMTHGLERLRDGFPLSLRFIREIHEILLSGTRGAEKHPGEFRSSQNWVGGTRPGNAVYVPPPPDRVMECMGDLEKFLHDDTVKLPILVKAAIAHVQFESIHPFLDGNGRVGRLLITFLLCVEGALSEPVLYLSLYLKTHRSTYYDLLQQVRERGAWEVWLEFFLNGVAEAAEQAIDTAARVMDLFEKDREKIGNLGRVSSSVLRVHEYLQRHIYTNITVASDQLGLSWPTVKKSMEHLIELGIVTELSGRKRGRLYYYPQYMKILSEGTEPIKP